MTTINTTKPQCPVCASNKLYFDSDGHNTVCLECSIVVAEGSIVVTEIIVVKEECTDDQPWRKTPAPIPCIALRSPHHTPKLELDNGDDEEKDDDEFDEDAHNE
ncbi:hypothetical protein BGZ74_011570 [Mortierella antarctica]|nr:hypothetical protein BGZ74_011570 [Mortierella antarctica]